MAQENVRGLAGKYRGFIMDAITLDAISFDYYDHVSLSVGSDWRETSIRLRSEPHHTYISTRARSIGLSGKLVASVDKDDAGTVFNVNDSINFLQSLNYPDYGSGDDYVKPPHTVRLWLAGIATKLGYIKDLSVTYDGVFSVEGYPIMVTVSFTFVEVNELPMSYMDVRGSSLTILGGLD